MENREIKFRAWNKAEKQMYLSPSELHHLGSWFDAHLPGTLADKGNIVIMQYTGLKDKKGVEIYEGDVATKMISPDENNRAPMELYRGLILYHYGGFCLKVGDYYYPISRSHGVIEVIGNVYQNSDLLK